MPGIYVTGAGMVGLGAGRESVQVKGNLHHMASSGESDSNGLGLCHYPSEYIRHDIASKCVPSPYRTGRHYSGADQLH